MDATSCSAASCSRERSFWEVGDYIAIDDGEYVEETLLGENGLVCGRGLIRSLDVRVDIVQHVRVLFNGERSFVLRLVSVNVEEVREQRPQENGVMRLLNRRQERLRALEHRLLLDRPRDRQQQEEAELPLESSHTPTRRTEPIQSPSFTPCANACCTVVNTSETKPLCFPLSIATRIA